MANKNRINVLEKAEKQIVNAAQKNQQIMYLRAYDDGNNSLSLTYSGNVNKIVNGISALLEDMAANPNSEVTFGMLLGMLQDYHEMRIIESYENGENDEDDEEPNDINFRGFLS